MPWFPTHRPYRWFPVLPALLALAMMAIILPSAQGAAQATVITPHGTPRFISGGDIWEYYGGRSHRIVRLLTVAQLTTARDHAKMLYTMISDNATDLWVAPWSGVNPTIFMTGTATTYTRNTRILDPFWSDNGHVIVYASDRGWANGAPEPRIWYYNLRTNQNQAISNPAPGAGGDADPVVSPINDKLVAYTHYAYDIHHALIAQIELKNLSSGQTMALTPESQQGIQPAWSPDGHAITYVRREQGQDRIVIITLPTGQGPPHITVSLNITGALAYPTWSPDGQQLAYIGLQDQTFGLWVLNLTHAPTYALQGPPTLLTGPIPVDPNARPVW